MSSVNVNGFQELMGKLHSDQLREEVEQVILFFRMIDCVVDVTYDRENGEYYIELGKDEKYFGSLCFLEDNDDLFSSIEVISRKHRQLQSEFLVSENKDIVTKRLGGIAIHKIKTERGHDKAIEVLKRVQLIHIADTMKVD